MNRVLIGKLRCRHIPFQTDVVDGNQDRVVLIAAHLHDGELREPVLGEGMIGIQLRRRTQIVVRAVKRRELNEDEWQQFIVFIEALTPGFHQHRQGLQIRCIIGIRFALVPNHAIDVEVHQRRDLAVVQSRRLLVIVGAFGIVGGFQKIIPAGDHVIANGAVVEHRLTRQIRLNHRAAFLGV